MVDPEELARGAFDAWRRGDTEAIVSNSAPDIVICQPEQIPDSQTYRGHDGVRQALVDWPAQWESFDVSHVAIVPVEARGAAILHTTQRLRSRETGLEFESEVFNLFVYDDHGKTVRWEMFLDVDEARNRLRMLPSR